MKIAYVFSTLAKNGGTERMITEKANYFAEKFGYEVTIINIFQKNEDVNRYPLSEKVKQINLGIPYYFQYSYKYPEILRIKRQINKQVKRAIIQHVQKADPDILIGISFFKANLLCSVKCRAKKIIECHEAKPFTHTNYSRKQITISRIYKKIWRSFYFRTVEQNADAIITLTEEDKTLWKKAKYIEVIPNFSSMTITKYSDCSSKRVIAVGRLEWEKGFDRLIEAWGIVSSRHNDWHLDIFGEGSMYDTLINLSFLYKAKNVTIHPVTPNISQEYANSSICVVSSYFEGFSLVLLEAMRHGVPCIAYDCPFGPRNIISDAYNGFLVENGDTRLFAEKICCLIEDEKLRNYFSKTSIEKANSYNKEVIMNKWKSIFEQITS